MANTTGKKFGGRQKGTPNKNTTAVKSALIDAFDRLGGIDKLVEFGQENPGEFYKLWVKVLPTQLNESDSNIKPITINIVKDGIEET
jgi:hypothetical protein